MDKVAENLERILRGASEEAGAYIRNNAFEEYQIEWKGPRSPVTELDKKAEAMIKEMISDGFKGIGLSTPNFIGEEEGVYNNGSHITFHVDSIDGTASFIRQDFRSALSIGVERDGELIGEAVYDFMKEILYIGAFGSFYRMFKGKEGKKLPTRAESDSRISLSVCNREMKASLVHKREISLI
jgi:fructose-1,6-bisphosphatase/inositol monophosphatase family enzyme